MCKKNKNKKIKINKNQYFKLDYHFLGSQTNVIPMAWNESVVQI